MKTRESDMPSEDMWQTFFSPAQALEAFGLHRGMGDVVDLGCGYGTFTIPAARITGATVHAFDIEPDMIDATRCKAQRAGLINISFHLRDFVADGTGLADSLANCVMLFNLLHAKQPEKLLQECYRILAPTGLLAIMHWNYDAKTPRGPSMNIRPKREDCVRWAQEAQFTIDAAHIDLPPYHYGIIARKP